MHEKSEHAPLVASSLKQAPSSATACPLPYGT